MLLSTTRVHKSPEETLRSESDGSSRSRVVRTRIEKNKKKNKQWKRRRTNNEKEEKQKNEKGGGEEEEYTLLDLL